MDWQLLTAIGAIVIAGITLLARLLDKNLSIREHDEYRHGADRTLDGLKDQIQRQLDRIDRRIDLIEQSRPTAGELQITSKSLNDRIDKLERK